MTLNLIKPRKVYRAGTGGKSFIISLPKVYCQYFGISDNDHLIAKVTEEGVLQLKKAEATV